MSANEFSERVKIATAAGDVAEVERLLASDWCAQWTAARAKDVLDEIRGGTLSPTSALNYALIVAISAANQLHVAQARCNALAQRVAELEQRKAAAYRGVWSEGTEYRHGDLVTHAGGLWHAWRSTTTARPGSSDDWQLTAKTR